MSTSSTSAVGNITDVYGIKSPQQAKRLLGDLISLGFRPAVVFAVDWRCRTIVAAETSDTPKFIYAKVGGPVAGIVQWSLDPRVFSAALKRRATLAIGRHLSGQLTKPLKLRYVENREK